MTTMLGQMTQAIPTQMTLAGINQVKNKRIREALLVMFWTGARYSEALQLVSKASWNVNQLRMEAIIRKTSVE